MTTRESLSDDAVWLSNTRKLRKALQLGEVLGGITRRGSGQRTRRGRLSKDTRSSCKVRRQSSKQQQILVRTRIIFTYMLSKIPAGCFSPPDTHEEQLFISVVLESRRQRHTHSSTNILAAPGISTCIKNANSGCVFYWGWPAVLPLSEGGLSDYTGYAGLCEEILSDRNVLGCRHQNGLQREAEQALPQREPPLGWCLLSSELFSHPWDSPGYPRKLHPRKQMYNGF